MLLDVSKSDYLSINIHKCINIPKCLSESNFAQIFMKDNNFHFNYVDSFQRHKNLIIWFSVQLAKISPLINLVNVALVLNLESYCVGKYSTKEAALRKKPHNCLFIEQPNRTTTFNNTFFERAPSVTSCALCSTTKRHKR